MPETKIRTYDDGPLRGGVICTNCSDEIEAYGEEIVDLLIAGTRPYVWRHVQSGLTYCSDTPRPKAKPYDGFAACRQITAAQLAANVEAERRGVLVLTRDVTREECDWLDRDFTEGEHVVRFRGATYGCITYAGTACSLDGETPFFELPTDAIETFRG